MDFLLFTKTVLSCVLLSSVFSTAHASTKASSTNVTVATFNVKWFGLGGSMTGSPANEKRDASLTKFIAEKVMPADVIVFEEVVDVPRLRKLLAKGWGCQSYDSPEATHQHVVACVSAKYKFKLVDYDNNNTIETVAINASKSRPAVRVNVADLQGKILFTLIGVHLKAFPNESQTRQFQAEEIAKDVAHNGNVPVLITGDFNTYPSALNGQTGDDVELILENLNQLGGGFSHIAHLEPFTYRSGSHKSQFDHFFLKGNIQALGSPDVFDVCSAKVNGPDFLNISYYNKNISDHCSVKLTVTISGRDASGIQ